MPKERARMYEKMGRLEKRLQLLEDHLVRENLTMCVHMCDFQFLLKWKYSIF